jgi:hypothetical protein
MPLHLLLDYLGLKSLQPRPDLKALKTSQSEYQNQLMVPWGSSSSSTFND